MIEVYVNHSIIDFTNIIIRKNINVKDHVQEGSGKLSIVI